MHQQHNYPAFKPRGSLDVGLDDGARDEAYLTRLEAALPRVMARVLPRRRRSVRGRPARRAGIDERGVAHARSNGHEGVRRREGSPCGVACRRVRAQPSGYR
jgi:hypothetical protein